MIPYPSGILHIGHCRNYIIVDILNRFINLKNNISKFFMGWDCFGSPAENISLIYNITPIKLLNKNIFYMIKQLKYIDFSLIFKNDFKTFKLSYYYFNQLFFLKLIKNKLIYLSNKKINWDDCDKTVLSNEQVIHGKGWRSDCFVLKKKLLTYYINLKFYKFELLNEINNLNWPEKTKLMQKKWILEKIFYFYFYIFNFFFFFKKKKKIKNIIFFFFYFINFNFLKINFFNYLFFFFSFFILNKGFSFKNFFYIYFENWFSKKLFNYKKKFTFFFFFKNFFLFFYFIFSYITSFDFFFFLKKKKIINFKIFWKIKDWGVSRQKYWGTPIPAIFCNFCKKFYSIDSKNPFLIFKNLKKNNLFYLKNINKINCFICNKKSFKEFEILDTFIDSSWYFLKYLKNKKILNFFMPIDEYVGGIEHSILHLLYSRFIVKFLRDIKYLNFGEPFKNLFCQGMILNKIFFKKNFFKIEKMSKSKNNVINPEKISLNYNVNCFRMSILKNSLNKNFLWSNNLIIFSFFFFKKVIFFFKNFYLKKILFFKYFFLNYNFKKFFFFLIKNLKKIIFFFKNKKYNNIILFFIKIFNIIKKNKFFLNFNFFFIFFFFKFLKIFYVFFPLFVKNLINLIKFIKLKKLFYIFFFFKFFLKKKNKKSVIIGNKFLGNILFFKNFLTKKKILNFLFFKKKIKKKNIKIIFKTNLFFNILLFYFKNEKKM